MVNYYYYNILFEKIVLYILSLKSLQFTQS